jgi:hypothetical protein
MQRGRGRPRRPPLRPNVWARKSNACPAHRTSPGRAIGAANELRTARAHTPAKTPLAARRVRGEAQMGIALPTNAMAGSTGLKLRATVPSGVALRRRGGAPPAGKASRHG